MVVVESSMFFPATVFPSIKQYGSPGSVKTMSCVLIWLFTVSIFIHWLLHTPFILDILINHLSFILMKYSWSIIFTCRNFDDYYLHFLCPRVINHYLWKLLSPTSTDQPKNGGSDSINLEISSSLKIEIDLNASFLSL